MLRISIALLRFQTCACICNVLAVVPGASTCVGDVMFSSSSSQHHVVCTSVIALLWHACHACCRLLILQL
jgi:hypothetical protein